MKKTLIIILIASFFACNQSPKESENNADSVVIQESENNEVVEPKKDEFLLDNFLSVTSETYLKQQFGVENVKQKEEWFAEGTVKSITSVLYPETDKEVSFLWKDDSIKFENLTRISVSQKKSPWHTKYGIKIGTRMTELVEINEEPFRFFGFGWDYSGNVFFQKGKLSSEKMKLILGTLNDEDYESKTYRKLLGDGEFSSDSQKAKDFNPYVVEIQLYK